MAEIVSWEHPHTTPGIYAFLGLATLPRFRTQANYLRLLPREITDRIARLAHRDTYLASWVTEATDERLPTALDITQINSDDLIMRMARPVRTGVEYVEITTTQAWYGTCIDFYGAGAWDFHIQLGRRNHVEICLLWMNGTCSLIKSLSDGIWSWCEDPVVFGVLVDVVRGCMTIRLNGVDGECVRFPAGTEWGAPRGVSLRVGQFPENDVLAEPLIVSCATPPVPPSLLEAAANPLSVPEHVAAGSFEDVSEIFNDDATEGQGDMI